MSDQRHVRFIPAINITPAELTYIMAETLFGQAVVHGDGQVSFDKSHWDSLPDEIKRHFR